MLTLYDIDNKAKDSWSPNTLKTKLAIAHKGLDKADFKHEWVSFPEIRDLLQSKGVPAASGPPLAQYTLPAIEHDGKVVMDSLACAIYLEQSFPDTPSLFPNASIGFCRMLQDYLFTTVGKALIPLLLPRMAILLDDKDAAYYSKTRGAVFGPFSESVWEDKETVEKVFQAATPGLKLVDKMLEDHPEGPFCFGKQRSYADCLLLAYLQWFRKCGEQDVFNRVVEIAPGLRKIWDASNDILN